MSERQWKLGEDMHSNDCIFDPITFEQIITALHCGEKVINSASLLRVAQNIADSRFEDFCFLVLNNENEIIAEALKRRK